VGPRGRSAHGRSCSGAFAGDQAPAQRWAFEINTMGAVDDAVENGVGQGGIANHLVPAIDRELAGDQQGSPVVAIVDDLHLTFNARSGKHDDLVLALAIAVWRAYGGGMASYGVWELTRRQAMGSRANEPRYFVGVDLGQSRDPTAIAVVRRVDPVS